MEAATRTPDATRLNAEMLLLRKRLMAAGVFTPRRRDQVLCVLQLVVLFVGGYALLATGNPWAAGLGVILLSLYYPQSAWLGHDLGHGQVFSNRRLNSFAMGLMAWTQGLSSTWWKTKHGKHHAHPNAYRLVEGKPVAIDEDINTTPLLVWDIALLSDEARQKLAWWLPLQKHALGPLLLLARLNWSAAGIRHGIRNRNPLEVAGILAHYAATFALALLIWPGETWQAVTWFILVQLIGGFMLGLVFILNHSGREVYPENKGYGFFDAQVRTTRNVHQNWLADWFTGGLNLQLEHHFFPNLPRHRLGEVVAESRRVVEQCGFHYESLGFFAACKLTWASLPSR
jgi:fatty acid desaturase